MYKYGWPVILYLSNNYNNNRRHEINNKVYPTNTIFHDVLKYIC